MKSLFLILPRILLVWLVSQAFAAASWAAKWNPISKEERVASAPRIDPEAGAEILYREVTVDDSGTGSTSYMEYVRFKIFNERGIEYLKKIELGETSKTSLRRVDARVVRPDGSEIELDKDAIYTRDVFRRGSTRVRVRSFTFPSLEPGCIVEYAYALEAYGSASGVSGLELRFQSPIPSWHVRFRMRPFGYVSEGYELMVQSFNYDLGELKPDKRGYNEFEQTSVPALKEEPWMPPEDQIQSWICFYYSFAGKDVDVVWQKMAKRIVEVYAQAVRPGRAAKAKAAELTEGISDPRERLRRLFDFCRTAINNVALDTSGLTPEEVAKLRDNRNPDQTLNRGYGSAEDINCLFIALATAADFEARVACVTDRSERFFNRNMPSFFTVPDRVAAVKVDDGWMFFDPGERYVDFGRLAWQDESSVALICDRKKFEIVPTPDSDPESAKIDRRFVGALDDSGNLDGAVSLTYFGHSGVTRKRKFDAESPERCAEIIRDDLRERLPNAEVTDVEVLNADNPLGPIKITYRLRLPEYADRVGQRMFVQPNVFLKNAHALFESERREHDIFLYFPWSEEDTVKITMPESFELEQPHVPTPIKIDNLIDYGVRITFGKKSRVLTYMRKFVIPGAYFRKQHYESVKEVFAAAHASDAHGLMIRKGDDAAKVAANRAQE